MRKRFAAILPSILTIVFFAACGDSDIPASARNDNAIRTIALTNTILIDGTGAEPSPGAVIVIRNEHILAVGPDSVVAVPPGADVIDTGGSYVLPGFINAHVHGAYDPNPLEEWARSGVTTVRDLGVFSLSPEQAFSRRDMLVADNQHSRLVAAGPMVTAVGGYGNYPVESPADAEEKTNGLIDAGADIIKIAIEDNLQGRTWPMLSIDVIKKIVETAHKRNKKVSAHVSRSAHLEMAVEGGVDDVAHMVIDVLPDSLITLLVANDVYWTPTLELWKGVSDLYGLNWDVIAGDNLRRFFRAGGKVALGTDYDGYTVPFDLGMPMVEMRLMRDAGMTPLEIVTAATKNAAYVCDMENELGTIEPGRIADLIILENNPVDDLFFLTNVRMVIHNGEIIVDNGKHP